MEHHIEVEGKHATDIARENEKVRHANDLIVKDLESCREHL